MTATGRGRVGRAHIVVVTGQHMVANPRVWKEANTLSSAGFRVTVLTVHYDGEKARRDRALLDPDVRYLAAVNLIQGESGFSDVYLSRVRRRLAFAMKRHFGRDSTRLLAYRPGKMVRAALAQEADLYICHQETGLIVGDALRRKGRKVAFDVEDWYSRDYVNPLRAVRLLDDIEREALQGAAFVTCPSRSMSDALHSHHGLPVPPAVLYNGFSVKESVDIPDGPVERDTLVWFSQVIGPERGLETLAEAMGAVRRPMAVHLVGEAVPGFRELLISAFSKGPHTLVFHPPMEHERLLPFIARFDIGLAIENRQPESRDTTVTNKILQYMQAGNRILATDTRGQVEVARHLKDRIRLVRPGQPSEWADAIEHLNVQPELRTREQSEVFRNVFSWEAQEPRLLELVGGALS